MDIFENDFITVRGKKQAEQHIIERYGDFGWKLTESKDDKLYADVSYLSFTRPHFIENKDELQLLQVRLELAYNKTGKYSHKSGLRAKIFGDLFALLSVLLAVGGVFLMLLLEGAVAIACGSVLIAAGVATGVIGGLIARRVYFKDAKKYAGLIADEVEKIEKMCARARELRGEQRGENEKL